MGRPPLTEDEVRERVLAYCRRYGVSAEPDGLPPFPSGKREAPQHREWMTVYRAHRRSCLRAASAAPEGPVGPPESECPVCRRHLAPGLAVPYAAGKRKRRISLHPACAELARLAGALGPAAVARLRILLWPTAGDARSTRRPPRG